MSLLLWVWGVVWAGIGLPVASVDLTVDVDGPLAQITVDQVFVNDSDVFIEGIYVFPLHEAAAVDAMRIEVAGQIIEGQVQERQLAEQRYEEALEAGHVAAMTTQARPNVFTQYVGNLPPGEQLRVQLRVVQPVPHVDGAYELTLPLVAGPRFVRVLPGEPQLPEPGPVSAVGGTELRATVDVQIDSPIPLRELVSPSHDIGFAQAGTRSQVVTSEIPMDRDFVLKWWVGTDQPQVGAVVQDGHLLVTLEPPHAPPREQIVPRELIWVIDQSCSMSGQPIELVRATMLEALEHVDERDSLRIMRFNDQISGDRRSQPATPEVLAAAREQIRQLDTSGGTYLLEGVLEALKAPEDPIRERYVMFLTDGLVGTEHPVLEAIAEQVGGARLFAFGVGASPNRWLLDEMASLGGGKVTWIRSGESPADVVRRFVDTIDAPVLTDITFEWGDWGVSDVWPERLPALYAGQPLALTGRIRTQGQVPILMRGRLGEQRYEAVIEPTIAAPGRAIPSTWARQAIAHLERQQLVWPDPHRDEQILGLSLEYQVLSRHTAFLAVDRTRVVKPGGPDEVREQPADRPDGMALSGSGTGQGGAQGPRPRWTGSSHSLDEPNDYEIHELVVSSHAPSVYVESTSRGQVLTKEFVQRVPAGRSYQTAVTFAAGVQEGVGGNPNMGGAYNENTYMLDGVNVTDPVTGTFSMNFNVDAIQQTEVLLGGYMPEYSGAGNTINVVSDPGNNNLDFGLGAGHTQGLGPSPLRAEQAGGWVSGPLVRDKLWARTSYQLDDTHHDGRDYLGHALFNKLTLQPNANHRFAATSQLDVAEITEAGQGSQQLNNLGIGRWQWFLSPEINLDTSASAQHIHVDRDDRDRTQAKTALSLLSIDDPLGGTHDLKLGVELDRVSWDLDGDALTLFGDDVPRDSTMLRLGAFAQDSYKPVSNVTINGGLRTDVVLQRAHLSPRIGVAWDPFKDQRTKLAAYYGRRYGHLALPALLVEPEAGLSRLDEALAILEREVLQDLAVGLTGIIRSRTGVPTFDGDRAERFALIWSAEVRKIQSRRWWMSASYTHTTLQDPQTQTLVDDGSLEGFGQVARGHIGWDLPTDPWTQSVSLFGSWYADPLGTLAPDPAAGQLPNVPRWVAGGRLQQRIEVPKGRFIVDLEGAYYLPTPDARDLATLVSVQPPLLFLEGWEGWRLHGGLRYEF